MGFLMARLGFGAKPQHTNMLLLLPPSHSLYIFLMEISKAGIFLKSSVETTDFLTYIFSRFRDQRKKAENKALDDFSGSEPEFESDQNLLLGGKVVKDSRALLWSVEGLSTV